MDRDEQIACLRLIRTPNIGPMTFSLLLQRYGSAAEALRAVPDLARRGGRLLKPASRAVAEAELTANERAGARLLFKGGIDKGNRYSPIARHKHSCHFSKFIFG